MEKFIIPEGDPYQENAKAFIKSRKGKQLKERYAVKPYEEQYAPLYHISVIISYAANLLSIITASTWVFTWLYSVVHQLPYPTTIAGFIAGLILLGLEWVQRFFCERFFKKRIPFGYTQQTKSDLRGLFIGMLSCAAISIIFSFLGGFDVVKNVISPPLYQEPVLENIETVQKRYQNMVDEADKIARDYYNRRKYRGRIATEDAGKYQEYLDKKIAYQDSLLTAVTITEQENIARQKESQEEYEAALAEYEVSNTQKGTGLGGCAVIFIGLFYLSMWYQEYYHFQTIAQYALIENKNRATPPIPSNKQSLQNSSYPPIEAYIQQLQTEIERLRKESPTPPTHSPPFSENGGTEEIQNKGMLPIGFYTDLEREAHFKNLYIQHIQPYKQLLQATSASLIDKYTIAHKNLKNGKWEHLDFGTVNNRVSIYLGKIEKSLTANNWSALQNQVERLNYWIDKRHELVQKMKEIKRVGE